VIAGVVMVTTAVGAGAWIAIRPAPMRDDCQTAREMLDYSRAESNRLIATGIDTIGVKPQQVVSDYTTWAQQMHNYANELHDPTLHQKATVLATADSDFVELWKRAALNPQPASTDAAPSRSDQALSQQYLQFAEKDSTITRDLLGLCP
jgi:hypothetical protein